MGANDAMDRMLLVSSSGLEQAKRLVTAYKQGQIPSMTPELWEAKSVLDSTLHPGKTSCCPFASGGSRLTHGGADTGEPVFLPFRMSCFVLSNLVVTAGMLTPGLKV